MSAHRDPCEALSEALRAHRGRRTALARSLGVHNAHVYNALPTKEGVKSVVSPTLFRAMIEAGMIERPPKRVRLIVDLQDDLTPEGEALARRRRAVLRRAFPDLGELARWLADELLESEGMDGSERDERG